MTANGTGQPTKYDVILADCPWPFETYSDKGKGKSPEKYYQTMPISEIAGLKVAPLTADNCALFLWSVKWLPLRVYDFVANSWGFRYGSRALTWIKLSKSGGHRYGNGYYTRSQVEVCYLYIKGSMPVADRGVPELIYSPLPKEHSRKPEEQYSRIERLYPNRRYLELFARRTRLGWTSIGNGIDGRDIRESLVELGQADIVLEKAA